MTPEEAYYRIEKNEKRLSSYATEPARVTGLIQNIKIACDIYLETPPPGELQREIKALTNAVNKRPMDVPRILKGLSPNTTEFISEKGAVHPKRRTETLEKHLIDRRTLGAGTRSATLETTLNSSTGPPRTPRYKSGRNIGVFTCSGFCQRDRHSPYSELVQRTGITFCEARR